MRPWQFSKPKNPGFGIARDFYLTVLAARAPMPSIQEIVHPKGLAGAIEGFGVPLVNQKDPSLLVAPITRGNYAIASKDRKTVLRLLVMARDEAGFDPELVARSELGGLLSSETLARIRATWMVGQITFESHDAEVYPALDFLQQVVIRFGLLADGVIADPLCRRYLQPSEVEHLPRLDPRADVRDHVALFSRVSPLGVHCHTRGLQKFGFPELELLEISSETEPLAKQLLLMLGQRALMGDGPSVGERIGGFQLAAGGHNRVVWSQETVLELRPPVGLSTSESLIAWKEAIG